MSKKVTVSVIMNTYNHAAYIEEAIRGVVIQKCDFNIELIIVNDYSTDTTDEVIKDLLRKLSIPNNIIVIYEHTRENMGPNPNYIWALKKAQGKYIANCEGDDYWTDPLKLQKQVDFLEGNLEFGICFHRANLLKEDGAISLHPVPEISNNGEFVYADLLKYHNFISTASVLFRNSERFDIPRSLNKTPFGDLGLYLIVTRGNRIKCLDEVMSVYRIHEKGAYSKLNSVEKSLQYLSFYSIVYPLLNKDEQNIVKRKREKLIKKLSKLKYPNSNWLCFGFQGHLKFKYSLRG